MLVYRNHYVHLIFVVVLALLLALILLSIWAIPVHAAEPPIEHWQGEYYNNLDLSGLPELVRDDAEINFD